MLAAAAFQNPVRRNAKMKKNTLSPKSIIAILIAAIIALTAFVPVSAYGGRVYVADETDSIPAEELAELNEYAEHASETCGTDILFLLAEDEAAAGDSIVDYMANYPNMGNGESRIFLRSVRIVVVHTVRRQYAEHADERTGRCAARCI